MTPSDQFSRRRAGIRLSKQDHEDVARVRARYSGKPPVPVAWTVRDGDIVYYRPARATRRWSFTLALVLIGIGAAVVGWLLGTLINASGGL